MEKKIIDLDYDSASLLPPCREDRLRRFERWLSEYWEEDVQLPQSYIDHILRYHGGCPGKACFRTVNGEMRMVGRFFNFLERDELLPLIPSWRQWNSNPDVRLNYRVKEFLDNEFWCIRLENAGHCLPIAGLDTAGHNCRDMDEMNLLCLNYNATDEPTVVVWDFPGFQPVTAVAPSFTAFLEQLFHCPAGIVSGPVENW